MLKKIFPAVMVVFILGLLLFLLLPSPVEVDVVEVQRGLFVESVEDEGFTVLRYTHVYSAPLDGYMHRIDLEEGDQVSSGEILFTMEPNPASFLDLRSLEQARQDVESARSGLKAMEAEHVKSVLQTRLARSRFKRHSELYHQSLIPEEEYEHYKSVLDQSIARENSALQAVESARHQLKKALAMTEILAGQKEHMAVPFNVRADTDGVILKRHRFQEGIIRAGDRIMETGKLEDMEVQVDLLSVEAARISPGMHAEIRSWGGSADLQGRVRMIEPAGFKKVSALGVDEQRVSVFVEIISPRHEWQNLGPGYRVEARIIITSAENTVVAPTGALFREKQGWHAFVVENNKAVLRRVEPGRRSGLDTEILEGLVPGETIINYPLDSLKNGSRIKAKKPGR